MVHGSLSLDKLLSRQDLFMAEEPLTGPSCMRPVDTICRQGRNLSCFTVCEVCGLQSNGHMRSSDL